MISKERGQAERITCLEWPVSARGMGGCYDRLGQEIDLGALLVVRAEQMAMVFRAPAAIAALKDCDCSTLEGDVFGPGSTSWSREP